MKRLNAGIGNAFTPPAYDPDATGVGIVHIGPGAFHRAHQAVFTEDALAHGGDWRICGVQMRSSGVRDALQPQDCRYTLVVLDETPSMRVIHSVANVLVAAEGLDAVIERLAAPSTHIVTLTVTEKGYCLTPSGELDRQCPEIAADLQTPGAPQSAVGLLAAALQRRRDRNVPDLTVISCDNVSQNGRLLQAAVLEFAGLLDPSLQAWIAGNVRFPCTMVDSITPATDDTLRDYVAERAGFVDAMPVSRESYSQWVIEDRFSGPRPAWEKAGVTFTDDVAPFEAAKIRLLNGAHSALAYVGMLAGHTTVREAVMEPGLHDFVRAMMLEEVRPTLAESSELDLAAYCEEILRRFRNPELAYRLEQIAWDGSQKVRIRLFGTIADNLRVARSSSRLVHAVAAWLQFVRRCHRDGTPMTDPLRRELLKLAARCRGEGSHDVGLFLASPGLFTDELCDSADFRQKLADAYDRIESGRRIPDGAASD